MKYFMISAANSSVSYVNQTYTIGFFLLDKQFTIDACHGANVCEVIHQNASFYSWTMQWDRVTFISKHSLQLES